MKKTCLVLSTLLLTAAVQAQSGKDSIAMVNDFKVAMPSLPQLPVFKNDTVDIRSKGAVGDGKTLNTQMINAAIDEVSGRGGGVVLIPRGTWLTGPVELKSNVNLHVDRGALVSFTKDKSQYHLFESEWEGHRAMCNQSPLYGNGLNNVAITGEGAFDGNGDVWRPVKREKVSDAQWNALVASGGVLSDNKKTWYPSESYIKGSQTKDASLISPDKTMKDYLAVKDFFRPNLLVLKNCTNVLLADATFRNSPAWCLHTLMCKNLTVRNIRVNNPAYAQNGDGIDVESCSRVLIEHSTFACGDDGICIKSGRDEFGRRRGMPTQDVIVRNNIVYHAHGGFVIGSEMSGGAHNIFVYDNAFIGTDNGLRFKTTRGRGGVVSRIYVYNISMKNIVHDAILFDMYYMATASAVGGAQDAPMPVTVATPEFQDFKISNIRCDGAARGLFIRGLPEMSVKNVDLTNIDLRAKKAVDIIEAADIQLKHIRLSTDDKESLIDIHNATNVVFDSVASGDKVKNIFSVSGKRNRAIVASGIAVPQAKNKVVFSPEADKASFSLQ